MSEAGGTRGADRFRRRLSPAARDRLAVAAAAVAMAIVAMTGWLLRPELPDPPYRVEFATDRPGMVRYPGTILAGGVEPLLLRPGPSARGEAARRGIERGAPMGVFLIAAPPTRGLAPVFALYDPLDRAAALVAVDSTDIVVRELTRAGARGLASPAVRIRGALAGVEPGDTVRVAVHRSADGYCYLRDDGWDCGHGIGAASGWRVIAPMDGAPARTRTLLGVAWLGLLALPIGLLARWPAALGLGLALAWYVIIRVPLDTVLVAPELLELAGVPLGVAAGLLLRRAGAGRRGSTAAE
jgi:hypothetical protein